LRERRLIEHQSDSRVVSIQSNKYNYVESTIELDDEGMGTKNREIELICDVEPKLTDQVEE